MPPNSPYTFEACVETAQGFDACAGLIDRIELCNGLELGGLTPGMGMMQAAVASGLETHVLIRPRTGGFDYDAADCATMLDDIGAVRALGLHGVVIGASHDGGLDLAALARMASAADGLDVTLHRVIDVVDDPLKALEQVIELGFTRILTSGGAASAAEGIAGLRALHQQAAGRIEIMAGSGIDSGSVRTIAKQTGLTSFHASCTRKAPLADKLVALNFGKTRLAVDPDEVRAMRDALTALSP